MKACHHIYVGAVVIPYAFEGKLLTYNELATLKRLF
jgi:hypothetical protein